MIFHEIWSLRLAYTQDYNLPQFTIPPTLFINPEQMKT